MPAGHEVVALTVDRPEDGLRVGAVVHCYADQDVFEIEFVDEQGRSKCVTTIPGFAAHEAQLFVAISLTG